MDLIKDMSMEVQLRLCRLLDVDQGCIVKDARHLAQEIGIDNATIQVLWNGRGDGAEKPTAIILRKMETLYGTVDNLQNLLSKIKRLDCVELLQEAYPHLASPPDKAEMPGTLVKATTGAVLTTKDATLQIGAGSLPEDAKITMEQCDKYSAFQDIVDKGLLHCFPVVLKFTPCGLTFPNKAADLTVRFEDADAGLKVFVLHGHYDTEDRRVVWKLDNEDVKREGEFAHIVMKSFCYRVICLAVRPYFRHILSILNRQSNCYATALYREISPSNNLQVAVVLWTEFVEEPPKQLKILTSETNRYRYTIAEEGTQKLVCTQHPLKVDLELPGANQLSSKEIEIRIDQLDKAGMVIDNLPEIEAQRAIIRIFGCYPNDQLQHFWTLRIGEITRTTSTSGNSNHGRSKKRDDQEDGAVGFSIQSDGEPDNFLTDEKIAWLAHEINRDWERVAVRLDFSRSAIEVIKANNPTIDVEERCSNMLRKWKKTCKSPTVSALKNVLEDPAIGRADIFSSKRATIPNDMLLMLSTKISPFWKELGHLLYVSDHDIAIIDTNHPNDVVAKSMALLEKWARRESSSNVELVEALRSKMLQHNDLANELEKRLNLGKGQK